MDNFLVKNIVIMSLILGAVTGFLAPVPIVGVIMLFTVLLLAAPIVMVLLIMAGKIDITSTKDSIITGAIIGFCANFSFAIVYSILMAILAQIFNITTNFILSAMIINSPFWLTLIVIGFTGILCATTNAFSAFATGYIINFIRDMYEQKHPEYKLNNYKE